MSLRSHASLQLHERASSNPGSSGSNRRLPVGRHVGPTESIRLKSIPRALSQVRPSASVQVVVEDQQRIFGEVPSLPDVGRDIHLQLEEDVDMEKGDYMRDEYEPEETSAPSSPKREADELSRR
ncbi:hypothetical protein FRB95_007689 [Tulasnella sp. JGI-2019a]|nr:hypothetical protein FRB93_011279 [Tulasnella sp. JGI-2019a]KAG9036844.1 hypothetical protein FRB95_007689 [Tulasnella sp. JGI-2019a]